MNLAEFPISVASRRQPREEDGRKLDQISYQSSTYDPTTRRRVPQRVTLTTSSRYGLPTPADENVVLALLFVAKRTNDFRDPRVYFVAHQLFQIMGWSANSRSYDRLEDVLDRLSTVQIKYENAWWDATGREYKEVFATGIISEYRLRSPKTGKKSSPDATSYVHWRPEFFKSLTTENIKKLDLELYFALKLPTTQRMYRFLDKRFYTSPIVELDLVEFACGHLGLTDPGDMGLLKQRLAPALAELEAIGFIAPASRADRYRKVKKGIWRIRLEPGAKRPTPNQRPVAQLTDHPPLHREPIPLSPAAQLVVEFYRLWSPGTPPAEHAQERAAELIEKYGKELVEDWLPKVVKRMRLEFPLAKHFQATLPFFAELAQEYAEREQHRKQLEEKARQRRQEKDQDEQRRAAEQAFTDQWLPRWEQLLEADREAIRSTVFQAHPGLNATESLRRSYGVLQLCLHELARRSERPSSDVADGPQTAR